MTFDLGRVQRRRQAASAAFHAGLKKPTTRRQARAWLAPIRAAFTEMKTGEVDAVKGYAVTRINHFDDYVRVDYAINGFLALLSRLMPDLEAKPLQVVGRKLAAGVPLTVGELDACFALLHDCEDRLITFTREELASAARTEQLAIEVESLGLAKESS